MQNLNIGGPDSSVMTLVALQNQKHDTSSIQKRLLTKSEIESLQKDKRQAFEKINQLFDDLNLDI
jgi:hypothetical protein